MDSQIIQQQDPSTDSQLILFTTPEIEENLDNTIQEQVKKSNKNDIETESMNSFKTDEIDKEIDQAKFNSQFYRSQMMQEMMKNKQLPNIIDNCDINNAQFQQQNQVDINKSCNQQNYQNDEIADWQNEKQQIQNDIKMNQCKIEEQKQELINKQLNNDDEMSLSDVEDEQSKTKQIPPVMNIKPTETKEQYEQKNQQPQQQQSQQKQQKPQLQLQPQQQQQIKQQNPEQVKPDYKKIPIKYLAGYLLKKSPVIFVGYHQRWCVLSEKKFSYYKTKESNKQLGCIDFDQVSASIIEEKQNNKIVKLIIGVKGVDKKFIFKAENENTDLNEWFVQLNVHISWSKGSSKNLAELIPIKRFWREKRISPNAFYENVDTGDLILFRTKNFASKFQRSLTGSDYDHVALLLRYNNQDIVLFEAAGKMGVGLISWKGFCKFKFHVLYDKLVVRHLQVQRTDQWIGELEKFVKYAIKKKYKVSLKALFKKKADLEEESLDNQNRTFFCSELVAAAYKHVGLINKDIASTSFWPGSFSAEKNLQLQGGAKLSEEFLIDFTLQQ